MVTIAEGQAASIQNRVLVFSRTQESREVPRSRFDSHCRRIDMEDIGKGIEETGNDTVGQGLDVCYLT